MKLFVTIVLLLLLCAIIWIEFGYTIMEVMGHGKYLEVERYKTLDDFIKSDFCARYQLTGLLKRESLSRNKKGWRSWIWGCRKA